MSPFESSVQPQKNAKRRGGGSEKRSQNVTEPMCGSLDFVHVVEQNKGT
jgi:hypothetical protein